MSRGSVKIKVDNGNIFRSDFLFKRRERSKFPRNLDLANIFNARTSKAVEMA